MQQLWAFLPLGYALTIAIETPILLVGLSARHGRRKKLGAALWLTACTYPIVVLVLPPLVLPWGRLAYTLVAETFAPVAECILFRAIDLDQRTALARSRLRDAATIVAANLASFAIGSWLLSL